MNVEHCTRLTEALDQVCLEMGAGDRDALPSVLALLILQARRTCMTLEQLCELIRMTWPTSDALPTIAELERDENQRHTAVFLLGALVGACLHLRGDDANITRALELVDDWHAGGAKVYTRTEVERFDDGPTSTDGGST